MVGFRSTLKPGTRIGRYECREAVDVGGLGELWVLRFQHEGQSLLALGRILHWNPAWPEESRASLSEAAWDAMDIEHAQVLRPVDVAFGGKRMALVYDYVEGQTLAGLIQLKSESSVQIPVDVVLRVALDALDALSTVHDAQEQLGTEFAFGGVSPGSLLISSDGGTHLLDALVAAAMAQHESVRLELDRVSFVAPEQFVGKPTRPATDVFALGCLLWELLSNCPLHRGTAREIATKVAVGQVPKLDTSRRPSGDIPPALVKTIARATAREPSKRFASLGALGEAIRASEAKIAERSDVASFVEQLAAAHLRNQRKAAEDSTIVKLAELVEPPLRPGRGKKEEPTSPATREVAKPRAAPQKATVTAATEARTAAAAKPRIAVSGARKGPVRVPMPAGASRPKAGAKRKATNASRPRRQTVHPSGTNSRATKKAGTPPTGAATKKASSSAATTAVANKSTSGTASGAAIKTAGSPAANGASTKNAGAVAASASATGVSSDKLQPMVMKTVSAPKRAVHTTKPRVKAGSTLRGMPSPSRVALRERMARHKNQPRPPVIAEPTGPLPVTMLNLDPASLVPTPPPIPDAVPHEPPPAPAPSIRPAVRAPQQADAPVSLDLEPDGFDDEPTAIDHRALHDVQSAGRHVRAPAPAHGELHAVQAASPQAVHQRPRSHGKPVGAQLAPPVTRAPVPPQESDEARLSESDFELVTEVTPPPVESVPPPAAVRSGRSRWHPMTWFFMGSTVTLLAVVTVMFVRPSSKTANGTAAARDRAKTAIEASASPAVAEASPTAASISATSTPEPLASDSPEAQALRAADGDEAELLDSTSDEESVGLVDERGSDVDVDDEAVEDPPVQPARASKASPHRKPAGRQTSRKQRRNTKRASKKDDGKFLPLEL